MGYGDRNTLGEVTFFVCYDLLRTLKYDLALILILTKSYVLSSFTTRCNMISDPTITVLMHYSFLIPMACSFEHPLLRPSFKAALGAEHAAQIQYSKIVTSGGMTSRQAYGQAKRQWQHENKWDEY